MTPNIHFRNEHAKEDFISSASAVMAGAYIGHKLDQTKAGRWVNESPTADAIVTVLRRVATLVAVGLFAVFVFCLMTV